MKEKLLTHYENVLGGDFAKALFEDAIENFVTGNPVWTNNYHWQKELIKSSFPWFIRKYNENVSNKILNQLYNKQILIKNETEYEILNYMGNRLSYMPWHSDHLYKSAVTIYLNPEWPRDWGGLFLYEDPLANNKICGYEPKFNTAVKLINGSIKHSVSLISMESKTPRVTIQIFPIKR
jgi:hypothetical protein